MKTGFRGTFVISWTQTEVDGFRTDAVESIAAGATWSWRGETVRVDGPGELLRLEQADGEGINRKRAARMVRRLIGAALTNTRNIAEIEVNEPLIDSGFVVTDGAQSYTVTLIEVGNGAPPLLMFIDEIPPRDTEMWVVHHSLEGIHSASTGPASGGVICFTPGTRIETPDGPRLVEELREGDSVQTKDNGAEEIQWIGSRRMTGARLFAMPNLRPVRFRTGALGQGRPDDELLVSPEHRMLVKGDVARALFNTPEVLVSAKDLINNDTISVDIASREVTYSPVIAAPSGDLGKWHRNRKFSSGKCGLIDIVRGGSFAAVGTLSVFGIRTAHLWQFCPAQPEHVRSGNSDPRSRINHHFQKGRAPLFSCRVAGVLTRARDAV